MSLSNVSKPKKAFVIAILIASAAICLVLLHNAAIRLQESLTVDGEPDLPLRDIKIGADTVIIFSKPQSSRSALTLLAEGYGFVFGAEYHYGNYEPVILNKCSWHLYFDHSAQGGVTSFVLFVVE